MKTISFNFEPELIRKFINFSWEVYKDDPHWIPPFKNKLYKQLSPQNPFLSHGEIKNFLVFDNKTVLARISAIINRSAVENDEQIGFLGFFECISDYSTTKKLLKTVIDYLHHRGIKTIRAPINFSTWHKYRFMTKGFNQSPFFLEPYNPSYYPKFFERFGFRKATGYISNLLENYEEQIKYSEKKLQTFFDFGYTVRKIDLRRLRSEFHLLYELSSKSFTDAWGYTEITFSEFFSLYDGFQKIIEPEFVLFAYNQDQKPVGFIFCMPNYEESIRRMNGKSDLLAKLRFQRSKHMADTFMVKSIGVLPEARGSGVGSVLMGIMHKNACMKGYSKIIHALMRSDNLRIRKISEKGGKVFKEYAVFELRL